MEYILLTLGIIVAALSLAILLKKPKDPSSRLIEDAVRKSLGEIQTLVLHENSVLREELDLKLDRVRTSLTTMLMDTREAQQKAIGELFVRTSENLERLRASTDDRLSQTSESQSRRLSELMASSAGNMEGIRNKVDERLDKIQAELEKKLGALLASNEKKLEEMRLTVNEKLEKTLESRLQKSFETVSTQLESVNKGLGEMKTVAESVGSLNKVLAGVKTRGILGELQLGQIIEDMLPAQLYDVEVPTVSGSRERVEYAIKFPGSEDGKHVYLPIDSKFPLEDYYRLLEGYESGDSAQIDSSRKALLDRVKWFAKEISRKYVSPPETTNFAVIFLPTESLYSEIVRDAGFLDG
ncbi:MAG: DNA recombination protein RmuC, partial [Oscillospiraceae bacterium]|nr:DNA recombination protein RmuC [Oscillospiraceae bacterium]